MYIYNQILTYVDKILKLWFNAVNAKGDKEKWDHWEVSKIKKKKSHFGPTLIRVVSRSVMQIIVLKTLNVAFKGQQDFILSPACLFSAGTFMESDQCRSSFDTVQSILSMYSPSSWFVGLMPSKFQNSIKES